MRNKNKKMGQTKKKIKKKEENLDYNSLNIFNKFNLNIEKSIFLRYFLLIILTIIFINQNFLQIMGLFISNLLFLIYFPFIDINYLNNTLLFSNISFSIVKACIAPSAYILISFFILTIQFNNFKEQLKLLFKLFFIFSIFNIFRIFLLILIYILFGNYYFNKFHLIFYDFLSVFILGVILIYYFNKNIEFKNKIPLFSDLVYLLNSIKLKK